MTPELEELAKRAVASKHWRWLPGMRAVGRRTLPTAWFRLEESIPNLTGEWADAIPDLADPATVGCVIQLVCDAWGDPHSYLVWSDPEWKVLVQPPGHIRPGSAGHGRSKAEALFNALKAAR